MKRLFAIQNFLIIEGRGDLKPGHLRWKH